VSRRIRGEVLDLRGYQLVIFAGGAGRRFGLPAYPKALLEVLGKPLVYWQIRYALKAGFRRITIELGHRAGEVREAVLRDYGHLGDRIAFHVDEWDPAERPYGTGRALYSLLRDGALDASRPVLTLFADDLYRRVEYVWDLIRAYERGSAEAPLCGAVLAQPGVELPYGVVYTSRDPHRGFFEEKPRVDLLVSAGMYIISPEALQRIEEYIPRSAYYGERGEISFEKWILEPCSKSRGAWGPAARRVAVARIAYGDWLPVNDWKALERAEEFLAACPWAVL
jgi:NDP-sugar pyrophosphorylase family protein